MHSSISSSNSLERVIPRKEWGRLAVVVLISTLVLTLGWEFYWRSNGYVASVNDNKDAWALIREKVQKNQSGTVLIGASRMLFDFNLDVWKEAYGELPLQLATVGTNAFYYLEDIALNTDFNGLLLVGITPPLFFVPDGLPVELPTGNIKYFQHFSPAQRMSHQIGLFLDKNLVFIEQEDIPLKKLLDNLPIRNRAGAQIPKRLPPNFMDMDERRQGTMSKKTETNVEFQQIIQNIWLPLFTPPPPPPTMTLEEFKKIFNEHVDKTIAKTKEYVDRIQTRGGKVIFIRFPSTDKLRDLENRFSPRTAFYDRLANETNVNQSIHFEDYSTLKDFQCPEWSHLTAGDAIGFTRELIKLIQR